MTLAQYVTQAISDALDLLDAIQIGESEHAMQTFTHDIDLLDQTCIVINTGGSAFIVTVTPVK